MKFHNTTYLCYFRLTLGQLRLIDMLRLSQSSRNRKFAKLVLRMVFMSLETFLESFQLSDFNEMQSKIT